MLKKKPTHKFAVIKEFHEVMKKIAMVPERKDEKSLKPIKKNKSEK